jgi:ASC-1-like (ASCH) protein
MRTHNVKCWPHFYERVKDGSKTFDVRVNDRDYQAGDHINLQEFDPKKEVKPHTILNYKGMDIAHQKEAEDKERYTGQEMKFRIGYVMPLNQVPQMSYAVLEAIQREKGANLVILSLLPVEASRV